MKKIVAGSVRRIVQGCAVAAMLVAPGAFAAESPDPGIMRIVVPYPPGGTTDILGRLVAEKLAEPLKTSVVVENRPGAGGNIGTTAVARAKPDGNTLVFTAVTTPAIAHTLYKNLSYDVRTDLTPVAVVGSLPFVLLVSNKMPAKTLPQLIALAKEKPGTINFGSAGVGTTAHLAGEFFKSAAGIDIVHVPYKGNGPALADLMGGHLDMMFDFLPSAIELIKSERVRGLAVTSKERSDALPDIPTAIEAGMPDYSVLSYFGLMAPADTPEPVLAKLNTEINKISTSADNAERYAKVGVQPAAESREWFAKYLDNEIALWKKVIETANVRTD